MDSVFNNIGLVFIPIVNIDSYFYISNSYGLKDFLRNSYKWKNMNENACKSKQGEIGVDLNRNYDYHFG